MGVSEKAGFPQQAWGFPTKNDQNLGCEMGYHHFWKHPYRIQQNTLHSLEWIKDQNELISIASIICSLWIRLAQNFINFFHKKQKQYQILTHHHASPTSPSQILKALRLSCFVLAQLTPQTAWV